MRRLILALPLVCSLLWLATCHRGVSDAEARLIAIDSLISGTATITPAPDSALSLLGRMRADSLPVGLRAYHDLLTVQAMYKADVPVTSDSLITRAWNYYEHRGNYSRRIRAMLYRGIIAEELGDLEQAMKWYKRTELESNTNDHYHRAYALRNMAYLYQNANELNQAIYKYLQALSFEDSYHSETWAYCTQQLAQLYLGSNVDSARIFIEQISDYVSRTNDSIYLLANLANKSMMWFYTHKYDSARDAALETINTFGYSTPYTCWYHLITSCVELSKLDSAQYYFSQMPQANTMRDSIFYFEILHVLNRSQGNWAEALKYEQMSNNLSDKMILDEKDNLLLFSELKAKEVYTASHKSISWQQIFVITLCAILIIGVLVLKRRHTLELKAEQEQLSWFKKQFTLAQDQIENLKSEKNTLQDVVSNVNTKLVQSHSENTKLKIEQADVEIIKMLNAQFKDAYTNTIEHLGNIAAKLYEHGDNSKEVIEQFRRNFELIWKNYDYWMTIENHINTTRNNAIKHIKDVHPDISLSELRLIMLIILNFDPMAITLCMGYKNTNVLYTMKNKLKKKLKIGTSQLDDYIKSFAGEQVDIL